MSTEARDQLIAEAQEARNLSAYASGLVERLVAALASTPAPVSDEEAHGADWSDWQEGDDGPSCKCGFNGTDRECATSRALASPATVPDEETIQVIADAIHDRFDIQYGPREKSVYHQAKDDRCFAAAEDILAALSTPKGNTPI